MFEKFNVYLIVPSNAQISFVKDEDGQVKGKYFASIEDNDFNVSINAKNVYEFFSKLCGELDINVSEKDVRNKYYSLITFDKMIIRGEGECRAVSRAKGKVYLEKFESHGNLDSYLSTLQNQVTTYQDATAPIQNL